MSAGDLGWRMLGILIVANAFVATRLAADIPGWGSVVGLGGFLAALSGTLLLVQGRRVAQALRIHRSRHRDLPLAIRSRSRRG